MPNVTCGGKDRAFGSTTPSSSAGPSQEMTWRTAQVVRQELPLDARPRLVEQGVDDLPHVDRARPAAALGGWDQGPDEFPLGIG